MSDRRNAILFDDQSSDRPHLDAQLEQERKMVRRLRRQLRRKWSIQDNLRTEFPWLLKLWPQ